MKKSKFYYGWIIFAVSFLMIFMFLGFGSSTKGTYLKAICDDLGFKRSLFTINDTIRYVSAAVLNLFFGKTVEKLGARRMVALGSLSLVLSFTTYSLATQIWHFYIGGLFLGIGFAWTTTSIVGYLTQKWFTNKKGTIMGIILAANGLGGVASENVITRIVCETKNYSSGANMNFFYRIVYHLSHLFHATGWRLAYRVTTVLFIITALIVIIFIRNDPADMGLVAAGQDSKKKAARGLDWSGFELSDVYKKPFFYVSGVCVFLMGLILQSTANPAKAIMLDEGISPEYVVLVFSVHSLTLVTAKILSGFMYDKFGIRISFAFCSACALVSGLSLALISKDSKILPWFFSIFSSFALPLETVMIPLLVSHMFGRKSFAKVMGYYLAFNSAGFACGVPLVNLWYDHFNSYKGIMIILTVIMFIASVVAQISITASNKSREAFLQKAELQK